MIPSRTSTTPLTSLKQLLGIRTQDTINNEPLTMHESSTKEDYQYWDINLNEDEILSLKCPIISSIDWNILTCVDQQIEDALQQSQQDKVQYDEFFQNITKEIRILQHESKEKSTFHS